VFAHHQDIVNAIYSTFEKVAVKVDGGVTGKNRQIAVDTFQTDEGVKLFVANLVAGSEGLTLTAASDVAFLEYGWTPGGMMQAEDRAHRIGQNDSVTAWYLTGKNTIDEAIITLIEKKACILDGVLDGKDSVLEGSIYRELLNTYMEQVS
jgi:SNF2 family DNA or RNA helicase